MYPEELSYTAEHEWVRRTDSGTVLFGITDYAQDSLGDIVYVSLPDIGASLTAGQACGEVESTKSVSDIYAPISGEVIARNDALDAAPEGGWMVEIRPADSSSLDALLSAADYRVLVEKG
jgi:glycine cleavage system H protein